MEETKEEIKKENLKQKALEKEFHKTKFGKLVGITLIVSCVLLILGICIMAFEGYCHFKDLDINRFKALFELGQTFLSFCIMASIGCTLIYSLYMPDKKNKEDEKELESLKLGIIVIIVTWYISLFYQIGYAIGAIVR